MLLGVIFLVIGLVAGGKFGFGRLPGDIVVPRSGFTLYIPITTMVIISLLLDVLTWFLKK